jgi:ankyrin repeat protein
LHYLARAKLLLNVTVRDQDIMKTIEFLISKNADLNIKDKEGKTPLDTANFTNPLVNGSLNEIIDLLRKHGAKTGEELKSEGK